MHQSVGHQRTLSVCAALAVAVSALAASPPASQPARAMRLDLLYLHARLLTCPGDLPDAARPIFADAARQKTWTASRTPVALVTHEQAQALVVAFAAAPGTTATAVLPAMLVPNRRVTAAPRPSAAASPTGLEIHATSTILDAQGALPLTLHAVATTTLPPAPPDHLKPLTATWPADLAVAAPVEQTLLLDLGRPSTDPVAGDDRRPHAYLLVRASTHPVERKDAAAADQAAGDLYRAWDRVWPLITQVSTSIETREFADAGQEVAQLREQLQSVLDEAEGTDFAKSAARMSEQLDATATAVRRSDAGRAARAFQQFQAAGNSLHATLAQVLTASGRLPTGPVTRPASR